MACATSAGSCASGPKGRFDSISSTSASLLPCTCEPTAGCTVILLQLLATAAWPLPQTSLQQAEVAWESGFKVLYACMLSSGCGCMR
jgi:hypothetical protein